MGDLWSFLMGNSGLATEILSVVTAGGIAVLVAATVSLVSLWAKSSVALWSVVAHGVRRGVRLTEDADDDAAAAADDDDDVGVFEFEGCFVIGTSVGEVRVCGSSASSWVANGGITAAATAAAACTHVVVAGAGVESVSSCASSFIDGFLRILLFG